MCFAGSWKSTLAYNVALCLLEFLFSYQQPVRVVKDDTTHLLHRPRRQALQQIVPHPLDIGPHEDRDDDRHDRQGDDPEEEVGIVLDRPHGLEVHALLIDLSSDCVTRK